MFKLGCVLRRLRIAFVLWWSKHQWFRRLRCGYYYHKWEEVERPAGTESKRYFCPECWATKTEPRNPKPGYSIVFAADGTPLYYNKR